MFVDTNAKGVIAEAEFMAAAIRLGWTVLRPINERARYDLAIDQGAGPMRVQCKWARRQGDVIVVRARTCRLTPTGYVRTTYSADEIDGLGVFCPDVDRCYLVPATDLDGRGTVHLRLEPARNGQRGAVTMAARYELGAIAQLGERLGGTQKVAGSSPASSTPEEIVIGSHEFREHFGWYLERSARGEQFMITRRGKPHARLLPPVEAAFGAGPARNQLLATRCPPT